jgi:HSP20 family protein
MKSLLPSLWSGRGLSDPFADLRREFDAMLDRTTRTWPGADAGFSAPVNIAETADAVEVSVELPGVDEKDVAIDIDGDRLVIAGEKKAEEKREDKNWRVMETSYGSFQRIIGLPFTPEAEQCDARFDKGVLRVKIARPKDMKAQGRRIEIRSGAGEGGADAKMKSGAEPAPQAQAPRAGGGEKAA